MPLQISGEEEAYSGLSMLIFHENFRGILSQYRSFDNMVARAGAREVALEVMEALEEAIEETGYYADPSLPLFWKDYRSINQFHRIAIYDKAVRVVRALLKAADDLDIEFEDEEEEEGGSIEIPAGFESEVAAGVASLQALGAKMVTSVTAMEFAIKTGDIHRARLAYEDARREYEQIEVLAISFEDVDGDIDARPAGFGLGEDDPAFKGFHKIERALFRDLDMIAATKFAAQLSKSTDELNVELNKNENFDVVSSFEGMIGLAMEVAAKKISSEEEAYSNLSVLIFEHNWLGIGQIWAPFASRSTSTAVDEALTAGADLIARISADASLPKAFAGADTKSYNDLPIDGYIQEIVMTSYSLATALVEAADGLGIFLDEENPFHKNSFFPFKKLG